MSGLFEQRQGLAPRFTRLLAAACVLVSSVASAQNAVSPFELERLELNPGARASLVVGGGRVLQNGGFRLSLAGHYQRDPLVAFRNEERLGAVISDRVTAHLIGAYGIGDRFEIGAAVPVVAWQQGDDLSALNLRAPASMGLGTPTGFVRVGILDEARGAPLSLAAGVSAGLPIGSAEALAREPSFVVTPRLGVSKDLGFILASVDASFAFREARLLGAEELGNQVGVAAAISTQGEGLRGELNVRSLFDVAGDANEDELSSSRDVEILAGVRYPILDDLEVYALGGPALGAMPGSPLFRVLLGIAYGVPEPKKEEPKPVDVCAPGQAQPVDRCPDLDKDGDGVRNAADACALQPEDADGYEDRDGCPDEDNDGDGVPDASDQCRDEKGLAEHQGCPPPDRDKDGILDGDDQCPDEPGQADRKGCPVRDADKDGIEDSIDACPNEAGPIENRGCPIKDSDADTVPDHLDNCVNEKGDPANQGCPKKVKQLVVITREKLIIKDKVYFATGKATILKRSFALLDQVARVINEHPEIPRVIIEGHTDNTGSADLNRKLSQARADAVREYLLGKKVDPLRLQSVGYGPDRPAAPNDTAKGREANRRVEFTVVDAPPETREVETVVPPPSDASPTDGSGAAPNPTTPAPAPTTPTPAPGPSSRAPGPGPTAPLPATDAGTAAPAGGADAGTP